MQSDSHRDKTDATRMTVRFEVNGISSIRNTSIVISVGAVCLFAGTKAHAHEHHSKTAKSFSGVADYYHSKFHGRKTASGQVHDQKLLTAAHRTLPFGTKVKVRNRRNGKHCVVTINDRGPFTPAKIIDVSQEAARQIDFLAAGTCQVECTIVDD